MGQAALRSIIAVAAAALVSSCASLPAKPTYTKAAPASLPPNPMKPEVVFTTDNQKAFLYARPIFEQSQLSERTLNTAHRRAALDLFSLQIMEYVLDGPGTAVQAILHGGDLLNNSCRREFEEAVDSLKGRFNDANATLDRKTPWFVTPGNHDGFYLGLSSPTAFEGEGFLGVLNELRGWGQVCVQADIHRKAAFGQAESFGSLPGRMTARGGAGADFQVMDKYSYVQAYIEALGVRAHCNASPHNCPAIAREKLAAATWPDDSHRAGTYTLRCAKPGKKSSDPMLKPLSEICWTELQPGNGGQAPYFNAYDSSIGADGRRKGLLDKQPWEHFVIQHLELEIGNKPYNIIIIDTSSYQNAGLFTQHGGLLLRWPGGAAEAGRISNLQAAVLKRWAKKMAKADTANETNGLGRTIILGHHPLQDFDCDARQHIIDFGNAANARLYMSGDTHDGYDVGHTDLLHGCRKPETPPKMHNGIQIREANIGATIDAPVEYAMLRPSSVGGAVLDRYLLSPGDKKLHGSVSTDGTYHLARHYAVNDGIWERCVARFGGFDIHGEPHAPLSLTRVPHSQPRLKQPISYLGLPYLQIWNFLKVRDKSLEAYKINRLLDMLDVMEYLLQLEIYSTLRTQWPQAAVRQARDAAEAARAMEMALYFPATGWNKAELAMNQLSSLVPKLEKLFVDYVRNSREATIRNARREPLVCAALFEAHRERP